MNPHHKKLFISVGEESADLHASHLCAELKRQDPSLEIFGFGGEKMREAGVEILYPLPQLAILGFVGVIRHIPKILKIQNLALRTWKERQPEAILLVDYPGFHLRLAKKAHAENVPVLYYIAPQAWAWKENRLLSMRETLQKLLVIFPFEEKFFQKRGINTVYVGHPLIERIPVPPSDVNTYELNTRPPRIGILPGSRKNEVSHLLPTMIKAAHRFREKVPQATFHLVLADTLPKSILEPYQVPDFIEIIRDKNYEKRKTLDFAWTASGTATVENALLGIPMAVVFRGHALNIMIGRRLVRIPYIGMVNLIAQKGICPEFIQEQCQPETLVRCAEEILSSPERYLEMKHDLLLARKKIGTQPASLGAANEILQFLNNPG